MNDNRIVQETPNAHLLHKMTTESDRRIEQAAENTEPISEVAEALVDGAVASVASDTGRTVEEQWERMGDRFAYEGAEMDPCQRQLDDYEIDGDWREVTA